jgi:hypothetical protein
VLAENTATRAAAEAFTVCDVWRVDGLPAHVNDGDTLDGTVDLSPPPEGLVVRVTTFAPDSEWDPGAPTASPSTRSRERTRMPGTTTAASPACM